MFAKHILVRSLCYVQTVSNSYIKTKSANLNMLDFEFNYLMNKTLRYYSDKKNNSVENLLVKDSKPVINSKDRIMLGKWIEMLRYEGERVPQNISEDDYAKLNSMSYEIQKVKYIRYLFAKELHKAKDKIRAEKEKALKKEKRLEKENRPKGHIEYGLWKNAMFIKTRRAELKSFGYNRIINAKLFGQPLVIDMDYYDHMEDKEVNSLASQLALALTQNRVNPEPFDLMLCNVDFNCKKFQRFPKNHMPNVLNSNFPMDITPKSYLDLFPREKLIYITHDAREEMTKFEHDKIYIIGGIVDLKGKYPLQLSKAKSENIQALRFPLEKYHVFKRSKSLAIHVMVNILLDLQKDGNFEKAFINVPRRLILTGDRRHLTPYK